MPPLDPERIREQSARLRRLAAAIVGDSLAEDVLQDVWVAALDGPPREPARSPAWLARVTHNLAWRRRIGDSRRRAREEHASTPEASEALEGIVSRIEEGHLIERALLELDEPYRSALLWRYYDGLSISEISHRSGRPESTTRTHLQRGLERLRERLKSEHGPHWRAALLPLLRVDHAAPVGASATAAGFTGVLMATLTKPILIAAVLLAGWAAYERVATPRKLRPALVEPATSSSAGTAESRPSDVRVLPPASDHAREELLATAGPPATPSPEAPRTTRALVVDPRSQLGIPGLTLEVTHASETCELTTDEHGEVELPFHVTRAELDAARPILTAEVRLGSARQTIYLRVEPVPDSEVLRLVLDDACSAWVRLPRALDEDEFASLSSTMSLRLGDGRTSSQETRYAPLLARGADLLFVLPEPRYVDLGAPKLLARVLRMSVDTRRGFAVTLPATAGLADPPYLAQPIELVEQSVRVRSKASGLPVFGAFVSLRELGRPRSRPVELAGGFTDKDGLITFLTVPTGQLLAMAHRQGFEFVMEEVEILGDGSPLELALPEVVGKSELEVEVRLARGPLPRLLGVTVFSRQGRVENMQGSQTPEPEPDGLGGWSARAHFSELPPGECRIQVSSDLPGLGTQEPFLVTLPTERVEIELATPPPTRPLRLTLPEGIRNADFWIDRNDRLRLVARGAFDGAQLVQVTVGRRPRSWILACEGHLPLFGRETAWNEARDENGEQVFALVPRFEAGTGFLVRVIGADGPLAGVRLEDPGSAALLAMTDDRGMALVRGVREGDTVRVLAEGFEPLEVELERWPFERCYLRAR